MNKLIWIIIDAEDNDPIIAATSREEAEQQLFDYMGWGNPIHEGTVRYLGFFTIEYSEHEDDYIGFYSFESEYIKEWEIQQFNLFCKEINKSQK
jgi:hypothetical protein